MKIRYILIGLSLCLSPVLADGIWTLQGAEKAAQETYPAVQLAHQQVVSAEAKLQQAEAQQRPQLSYVLSGLGANGDVIQPPPDQETFGTVQNSLNVNLPLGARTRLTSASVRAQLAAAQAQYQQARRTVLDQVVNAYYDVLRDQALVQVAIDSQAEAERQLKDATLRHAVGDVAQLDVIRAQVPQATAQAAVLQAANTLEVAKDTLRSLIGAPDDAPLALEDHTDVPAELPYPLDVARQRALARSPEMSAAAATVKAQEAALAAARLYRTPSLQVSAIDQRSNDQTAFSRLDTLQAQLTFTLSDGGLGEAQIRDAQASLAQAQAQLDSARRAALLAVATAWRNADSKIRQLASVKLARDVAQVSYDKTRRGYQNGLFPLSDVLTAYTALQQARLGYAQALYDAGAALELLRHLVEGIE